MSKPKKKASDRKADLFAFKGSLLDKLRIRRKAYESGDMKKIKSASDRFKIQK